MELERKTKNCSVNISKMDKEIADYVMKHGGQIMLNDPAVQAHLPCRNPICAQKLASAQRNCRRLLAQRDIVVALNEKKTEALTKKLETEKKQHLEMCNRFLTSGYDKDNIEKMKKRTAEAAGWMDGWMEAGGDIRAIDVNMKTQKPTSLDLLLSSAKELKYPDRSVKWIEPAVPVGGGDINTDVNKHRKRSFDGITKGMSEVEIKKLVLFV